MNNFLKKIFVLTFCLLLLNIIFYSTVFKSAYFDYYFLNKREISDYNVILLSDSHGEYLKTTPNKFEIFNFSNVSENYLDMYCKLQFLSNVLSKGDTVLISCDNHNLSSYKDATGKIGINLIYADSYLDFDPNNLPKDYKFRKYYSFIPMLFPELNEGILKYLKYKILNVIPNNNSDFSKLSTNQKKEASLDRFSTQFKDKITSKQQLYYLHKIIELCKLKEIVLIGIKFPVSKSYHSLIKDNDFGISTVFKENNLLVIDLQKDFFIHDEYFQDQDHLNCLGADFFCSSLRKHLNN